ncbi:MAG: PilZ domain-containing protein [Deltaproteobacteria bacterium]|nr:PilZ domain-containing protein [Deltaproteobacteria bacterium]
MALAAWIRDRLRRADSWGAELANIRQSLAAEPRSATTIRRTYELAAASEYCDPDRGRALALYLDAWRGGHADAGEPAKQLARLLGAHMTIAEIATASGELLTAATAFIDAGFPSLAVEPIERFVKTQGDAVGVPALLAIARGRKLDAEREIADSLARAHDAPRPVAAAAYVHAVRVARAANLQDRMESLVAAARRACPDDDTIAALVQERLFDSNSTEELLAYYSARLELTTSRAQYAERARAAGVELIARNRQPGLGLRLLRMSLEHAYSALLPDITSHIAAWELLWTHAQLQHSALDLAPLVEQALFAPLPDDDAVYLARLGLEISWRHGSDPSDAKPYTQMLLEFVPDHPLAIAFVTEVAPEMVAESAPAIAPQPATPTTPSAKPATTRIPVLEGQVKRAEPAPSTTKPPRGISGRMALLVPPPVSPVCPVSPAPQRAIPPTYPPRATRKVVPVDVVVELPGGAFFSTVLRDVSTSGAFMVTKRALEVGTTVALELRIPTPGAVTQSSHRTTARIVRRTDIGYGLAFLDASAALVAAIGATIP